MGLLKGDLRVPSRHRLLVRLILVEPNHSRLHDKLDKNSRLPALWGGFPRRWGSVLGFSGGVVSSPLLEWCWWVRGVVFGGVPR